MSGTVLIRFIALLLAALLTATSQAAERPNFLWLSAEDMSPNIGCYGDEQARTPTLDDFASRSVVFENAFVPCPVCATCRSSIITGVYSAALGTHHMRSRVRIPAEIRCFPEYLCDAGYYCTNNSKEDYNFRTPATAWDESSDQAHWKNRPTPDSPFFAVFNYVGTHESSNRGDEPKYTEFISVLSDEERFDPAKLKLPPYYPDTPLVRKHWARYYNNIAALDKWIAGKLAELDAAGLADDTIVFFWTDHGAGLPRHKRWLYDTGMRVPLIVHVPEKWRDLVDGGTTGRRDQLVSLVDLGPTVLNLAGIEIPAYMQGQAFLGPNLPAPREYVHATRDRMDESYDMFRAVRDKRYKYIFNGMPQRPYSQSQAYGDNSDIMREWRRLAATNELNADQALFMRDAKPPEELYDLAADPYELHNLADDPAMAETKARLSAALQAWMFDIRDLGVIPEGMLSRIVRRDATRYEYFRDGTGAARYELSLADFFARKYPADLTAKSGSAPAGNSLRVIMAERTLDDADSTPELRDAALATLIAIYRDGASPWDQAAAAGVLDLHVEGTSAVLSLAAANRAVGQQLRQMGPNSQPANSLRPWVNRFNRRFVLRTAPDVDEGPQSNEAQR